LPSLGESVKAILESTFDMVQGTTVVYVDPDGNQHSLPALIADDLIRSRREGVQVEIIGVEDQATKRMCFKTEDITMTVGKLDPAGHFLYGGVRYDFSKEQPIQDDLTPLKDAINTLTVVWVRRAIELENTDAANVTGEPYQFGEWTDNA
jgi:hypothetical protein